ncbi:RHS repeat-associated core domain-containing protein [Stenotrophomonas maltophilia]
MRPVGQSRLHVAAWGFGCPSEEKWSRRAGRCVQKDGPPEYPLPGLEDPETGEYGSPKCDSNCLIAGGNGSNPIDSATGNKRQHEVDFVGAGVFPLSLERTYNSGRALEGDPLPMGAGWTHSYSARLYPVTDGNYVMYRIIARRSNGARQSFTRVGDEWLSDADVAGRISVFMSGGALSSFTYSRGDGTVETYDRDGLLTSITDLGGHRQVLSNAYADGIKRLEKVTDPEGRSLVFTYKDRMVASVTLPTGRAIRYGYADGDLVSVSYPEAPAGESVRRYHYNELDQTTGVSQPHTLTGITDESGQRYASWGYDGYRRGVLSVHGDYATGTVDRTLLAFNDDGTTTVTDSLGKVRHYGFDVKHRVARLASLDELCLGCSNTARAKTYDGNGMVQSSVDFAGNETTFSHNARLLEVQRVEAANDATGLRRTVQTDWHPSLRVPVERRILDAANVLVSRSTWTYNARGQALAATQIDPATGEARTTTSTYCEADDVAAGRCPLLGLLTQVDGPRLDVTDATSYIYYPSNDAGCATGSGSCLYRKGDLWKVINAAGHIFELLAYDGAGRPTSVKDPNGIVTEIAYHPRGRPTIVRFDSASGAGARTTRLDYWPTGLVKRVTQPDGSSVSYSYDVAHRLTAISDSQGNSITFVLDNAGNRVAEETRDVNGELKRALSRIYNQFGQLTTEADSGANPTDFSYDANGNIASWTDALGRRSRQQYDPLNRLVLSLQDVGGLGVEVRTHYNAMDQVTRVTDPKGLSTTYSYNGFGDLTGQVSPDSGASQYTVDSGGNRRTFTDARGVTASYRYDALDRVIGIAYPDTSLDVSYSYDLAPESCPADERFAKGRLGEVQHAGGSTLYCYGRLGQITRKVQTINGLTRTVRYSYSPSGNLATLVYPDGSIVDYVRDGFDRVNQIGLTQPGQARQVVVKDVAYAAFGPAIGWTYGNGRRLDRPLDLDYRAQAVNDPTPGGLSQSYSYDPVGSIVALKNGSGSQVMARYAYDALGRLTQTQDGLTATPIETYAYDSTGNRTSLKTAGGTSLYTYPATSHHLTAVDGVGRDHDASGNTVRVEGKEYVYNDANRMAAVKQDGNVLEGYAYNHLGERILRVPFGGDKQITLYDEAGQWLGDHFESGRSQQAIWLDDYPVALISSADAGSPELVYIQPDHLGTPRVVVDPVRNTAIWEWSSKSEVFGNQMPNMDPDGDGVAFDLPLRFPGQQATEATGLFYNYQREYDPAVGRYSQSDPIGLAGGVSTYGYVGGAPTSFTDRFGQQRVRVLGNYHANGASGFAGNEFQGGYYSPGGASTSDTLSTLAGMGQLANPAGWVNPNGVNQAVAGALLNQAFSSSSTDGRSVPWPERKRGGYACVCRANRDGRSEGNCSIDDKEFAFGYGFGRSVSEAKRMAEKDAKDNLGAKSTHHVQCRCVSPTGDRIIPHG